MIEIKHLIKTYDHVVLDHIDFVFQEQKIYVIKGKSGCGKSTLLNILGGLDLAYEGVVLDQGVDLKTMDAKQRRTYQEQVGYVLQDSMLISQMSVMENLLMIHNTEEEIKALARQFQVENQLFKFPSQLSNGQRVRVAIIRALLKHPKILLLDEPTASLDQASSYQLSNYIASLRQAGRIVIIVTHDHCFDEIANEVIQLHYGKIDRQEWKAQCQTTTFQAEKTKGNTHLDYRYVIRKMTKKNMNWLFTISVSVMILVAMLSLQLTQNFASGLMEHYLEVYPTNVVSISRLQFKGEFADETIFRKLPNYDTEIDGISVFNYFPEELSSLAIPGAISYGEYPDQTNEVLITKALGKQQFPHLEFADMIQQTIPLEGKTYTIAGICNDEEQIWKDAFHANRYYNNLEKDGAYLFMSAEALSTIREEVELPDTYMMEYLPGKMNQEVFDQYYEKGAISYYFRIMQEQTYFISTISIFLMVGEGVLAIVAYLFIHLMIGMDLYQRRKQLGAFQLFGISSKRVYRMVLFEYVMKIVPSWILALILDLGLITWLRYSYIPISYGLLEVLSVTMLVLCYIWLVVHLPLKKLLKISIVKLMKQ